MVSFRRPSGDAVALVLGLAEQPVTWRYGYELCQRLDLTAGRLYPALMRLADDGLLETAWERDAAAGHRPRHRYRLTGPGVALADSLAAGSMRGSVSRVVAVFGWHRWAEGR